MELNCFGADFRLVGEILRVLKVEKMIASTAVTNNHKYTTKEGRTSCDTIDICILSKEKISAPKLPLFVFNEDFFFTSDGQDKIAFNNWRRKNGWYRPINILLVATFSIWLMAFLSYYLLFNKIYTGTIRQACDVIMGILSLVQGSFLLITVSSDTQDSNVVSANKSRNLNYTKVSGIPVINPETLYCNICQVHVNKGTKHCKV